MKGHVKIRGNFRSILVIIPAAIVMLFAFAIMLPAVSESTHAEGDEPEEGVSITISDPVSANLVLFNEGDYKIAKDTVHVSSSAPYGYELYLSTDSEEHQSIYLNNDPTSSSVISPVAGTIAEPAVLTSNTWGFAIAGQGNFDNEYSTTSPDPNSRFAIIPTTNNQAVYENNSATADDDIDFYYGIKIEPTLEPGEYTTSVSYTAIAKLPPLTAKAILGSTTKNLNFVYDRETYTVGETYTDNIGETTISKVYSIPYDSGRWKAEDFEHVNFGSSFRDFKPLSTAMWFRSSRKLFNIANPENLNTAEVTDMSYMFAESGWGDNRQAYDLEFDLSSWDTSKVTDMTGMFDTASLNYNTSSISIVLNGWDVSKVTSMSRMFWISTSYGSNFEFNLELKNWDVSSNPTMNGMFPSIGGTASNIDFSGWKIGSAFAPPFSNDPSRMPKTYNLNLSGWDVGAISSTANWFKDFGSNVETLNLNLSNWKNMTNITSMDSMFYQAGYNSTTFNLDLSNWNTSSVINMDFMFMSAGKSATTWSIGDLGGWNVSSVTSMDQMFMHAGESVATVWTIGDLSNWETGSVANMHGMFFGAGYSARTWDIGNIRNWDVTNVRSREIFFDSSQRNIDVNKLPWQTPW